MNLADFFDPDLINMDLKAETKFDAVERLADMFCRKYPGKNKAAILKAVIDREELGSTSFGRGFAFPHARTNVVNDLYMAFGYIKNGVKDKGPDAVSIKAICLLLTPRNISKLYLQTLSGLANLARRPGMIEYLGSSATPREFIDRVRASDIQVKRALTVADIMSSDVISVSPDDSLRAVANIMFKYNFDGVPVVDRDSRLLGDVSGRELLRSALPDYAKLAASHPEHEPLDDLFRHEDSLRVKDVMRRDIPTISETAPAAEAAAMMLSRNVERIMVIRDDRLVGIVSASDIISKIIRG